MNVFMGHIDVATSTIGDQIMALTGWVDKRIRTIPEGGLREEQRKLVPKLDLRYKSEKFVYFNKKSCC